MKHHYLSKIDKTIWNDIQYLKTKLPENVSVNSFINEGLRNVIDNKLQGLSRLNKNRESLESMRTI